MQLRIINSLPAGAELFRTWELSYGKINGYLNPVCYIHVYNKDNRRYIVLNGTHIGRYLYSCSAKESIVDLHITVKTKADLFTYKVLREYESKGLI